MKEGRVYHRGIRKEDGTVVPWDRFMRSASGKVW
jgi:hypothetical protein